MKKSQLPIISIVAVLVAFCVSQSRADLLLHYKLDEGTGITVTNSAASGGTGVFAGEGTNGWTSDTPGGTAAKPSQPASAYSMGGNGRTYISASAQKLTDIGDFTISFWLKLSDFSDADRIFSTRTVGANNFFDIMATNSPLDGFVLKLELGGGAGNTLSQTFGAGKNIDVSEWTYFTFVRKGDTISFLVGTENAEVNGISSVSGTFVAPISAGGTHFRFGGTAATEADRSPVGAMSDFRFYNEALDLDTIRANSGVTSIPEPRSAALWFVGVAACVGLLRQKFLARN